jgi:ABC-type branched-subunit amino acid transport system substrate-binding protein
MKHRRFLRIAGSIAALSLLAAGCGDDDDSGSPDTTAAGGGETDGGGGEATAPTCTGESDGVLSIGALLPETGSLAFLGPPEFAAAELAVAEINDNGGVLGEDVQYRPGDSGDTSTEIATQTVTGHLDAGVDAIVGAASSGVSFTVIDQITGACVIHFSPANTSPDFTDYDDDGLYFRTAPSDVLQGRVLADLMVEEDNATAAIMALQDPYGEGLLQYTKEAFEDQGGEVVTDLVYDPQAQNFSAEVDEIVNAGTDAVVVIGFDETSQILTTMFEAGVDPAETKIYLVDGNVGNALGENFTESGTLEGIAGTLPAAEITAEFRDRLLEQDPDLVDFSYGPETYDAVMIIALATAIAGTDDPAAVAAEIIGVTRDGTECTTFADCIELIDAGEDIDYNGPSGPQTFGPAGEPSEASFAILRYGDDNRIDDSLTEYKFAQL